MRVVIQRVTHASVSINGVVKSEIKSGFMILLGVENADNKEDVDWLSSKISSLRIFDDQEGIMNLSINDIKGDILLISQFTLHAKTKKGNRPSYITAAKPQIAIPLYNDMISAIEKKIEGKVLTGEFGADMKVNILNDGPVTIIIDSKNKE